MISQITRDIITPTTISQVVISYVISYVKRGKTVSFHFSLCDCRLTRSRLTASASSIYNVRGWLRPQRHSQRFTSQSLLPFPRSFWISADAVPRSQLSQSIPYFSCLLEISNSSNFFWKSQVKTLENIFQFFQFRSRSPNEHVFSVTIYPTLSEPYFRTGVRRHDHGAGYNDDRIQKIQVGSSSDPSVHLRIHQLTMTTTTTMQKFLLLHYYEHCLILYIILF